MQTGVGGRGGANRPPPPMAPRAKGGPAGHIMAVAAPVGGVPEGEMEPGFRMTIGADGSEIAKVTAAFVEFADAHALPAAVRRSLQVALDEMLSNTIMHGFTDGEGGEVTAEVVLDTDRVCITLTDDGRPFDPLQMPAPDTTLTTQQRRIGGLGIHLVRHMMDEISYDRRGDRNVLVLAKRLTTG